MSILAHDIITNCNEAVQQRALGAIFIDEETGFKYRYVKFVDAVTYAAGQSLTYASITATAFSVTNDRAGGSSIGVRFAGICLRVMTADYFGFALVEGWYPTIVTNGDDDIAAGDTLILSTTVDGQVDSVAAATTTGTLLRVGYATAADVDAADTVAGWVRAEVA